MSDLIVLDFDGVGAADEVLTKLRGMKKEHHVPDPKLTPPFVWAVASPCPAANINGTDPMSTARTLRRRFIGNSFGTLRHRKY